MVFFLLTVLCTLLTSTIDDEIQQSTALRWLAEFLTFAHDVVVPFTPRCIPAILPNLAHHVPMIQHAAVRTNKLLFTVIQKLPCPAETTPRSISEKNSAANAVRSPTPSATNSRHSTFSTSRDSPELPLETQGAVSVMQQRSRATTTVDASMTPRAVPSSDLVPPSQPNPDLSRPHSPTSQVSQSGQHNQGLTVHPPEETHLFDYQVIVNELTIQFLSEFEETRVAALKWLIMLHQKAPKKVCNLIN